MNGIYLIGPSGAGKSALCKGLEKSDDRFEHFCLDEEVKRIAPGFKIQHPEDWNEFWKYCEQALQELAQRIIPEMVYLIDSGAGALQTNAGRDYLKARSSRMICLNGPSEIIYERNKAKHTKKGNEPRPYNEFYNDEYSEDRQKLYDAAQNTIDTTVMDETDTMEVLRQSVEVILADNQSGK